jgi:hypothetical protein
MKVLVCAPGRQPEVRAVENLELASMQALVGGIVARVEIAPGFDLWFHQEGRVHRLPFNRRVECLRGRELDIRGTMFLAARGRELDEDGEEQECTKGLAPLEVLSWSQRFTLPEVELVEVPEGQVAVYHAVHPNFAGSYMWDLQPPAPWPHDFRQVAWVTVETDNETRALNHAFEKTNHSDGFWEENEDVEALGERNRSSSVGDVFVLPGGKARRADSIGFLGVESD